MAENKTMQDGERNDTFSPRISNNITIRLYAMYVSVCFLIATPIAAIYTADGDLLSGLKNIVFSPSQLVTDYFALGGLAATLLNAALCGLFCNIIMQISGSHATSTSFAGYMLVVAHAFYGLNVLNMWPPIIGVAVYCAVMKRSFRDNAHVAFFSTALAPFVSEFLFRYTPVTEGMHVSIPGIALSLLFGLAVGFVVPALLPGTATMHRGYSMYKAGLAIGLLGIFIYAFMYQTLGVQPGEVPVIHNPEYYALPYAYRGFMNVFFLSLFLSTLLMGFLLNKSGFSGYGALIKSTGYGIDYLEKFGMPLCLVNFALYGLGILAYLNVIFVLPEIFPALPAGVGFTGATVGVTFAALTFSADGQHPRNVYPISIGYTALFVLVALISLLCGRQIPWTLSTQSYINGLAFATGLCPFAGKYGVKVGILAGFISAVICASTAAMHGGLVLYNGGFNAGLTALVLIPVLDFYNVKPKHEDDTL